MATDDFFRARLDQMIDLRHRLAVLPNQMPWARIESALAPAFARKKCQGQMVAGSDLFGTKLQIAGAGISTAGRPRNKCFFSNSLATVCSIIRAW